MNAVIYARYSSDNQREESIEGQLRECMAYAERKGLTVVHSYIDRALSAKTDARPQFQKMIKDSNARKFEVILVWKLDRFSRNRYDSAYYKHLLQKNQVHVVSATEEISNSPEGILMESVLEGMAEYYSAELSQKIKRGNKENALKGKVGGGVVPLGYVVNEQQKYEIDPVTAPIVQEVFQRYANGETCAEIARDLTQRGLRNRSGKPFVSRSFYNMFTNRRYIGEFWYKDERIEGVEVPALVSVELFERVQKLLAKNKKAAGRWKGTVSFVLTTKLFCGKCGSMMAGESGTSKTGAKYFYYKCSKAKREGKGGCSLKPIRKDVIERFVVRTAAERILNGDTIERLIPMILEYINRESTLLPVLQKELSEVEKRLANLLNLVEEGLVTDTIRQRLTELETRKKELNTAIIEEQIAKPALGEVEIRAWFERFRHGDLDDPGYRQRIVDAFVNSVYVFEDRVTINFNAKDDPETVPLEVVLNESGPAGSDSKDTPLEKSSNEFLSCPPTQKALPAWQRLFCLTRPGNRATLTCGNGREQKDPRSVKGVEMKCNPM